MKLNKILVEDNNINKTEIADWVLEHVYYINNSHNSINRNDFRIEDDGSIHIYDAFSVKTDEKILPYKFYDWTDGFRIEAPNLETCKNLPIRGTNNVSFTFDFDKCNNLDFSLLSNVMNTSYFNMRVNDMNYITIPKIYKHVSTYRLESFGCASMSDCRLWDDIDTKCFRICFSTQIKNFTNILNIPKSRLEYFWISLSSVDKKHDSFYDLPTLSKLQTTAEKYRNELNAPEHSMDMAIELIDAGFEDIV